jgi:hypothetical protein
MTKKKWLLLLIAEFTSVLCLTPYINKYDILGWLSFLSTFLIIPFTIYKSLPSYRFSASFAMSTSILLSLLRGYWLGFYENHRLDAEGIRAKGIVTKVWATHSGRKENLFKARFKTNVNYQETFSHNNETNYKVGDSVLVDYLTTDPSTYCIIH